MTAPSPRIRLDDNVVLRRLEDPGDLPELHRVIGESLDHLEPWISWTEVYSLEWTTTFLSRRVERWGQNEYTYAIVLDGVIAGACQLHQYDHIPRDAYEIGYWLHPTATGRGLATRAVRALVEQAFGMPDVARIIVSHDVDNHASASVPARLGFTELPTPVLDDGVETRVWHLDRPGPAASPSH
ncbi:GNAT family N-acetyltransferase [Streptomyces sp. NPDC048717]|uniref:GNAT family N-acetyltransferase n=1 Tax=Streptomyces sp. NPDC048717 TaxID=3154928 RepID=UPI0034257A96